MANAKDIHHLIHSLTKNEQGFFIKYAQMQGQDKAYMDLYKKLQEMPEFDRSQLAQSVEKESYKKHLSVTQNYLYKILLKSLRLFNEKRSIDATLHNLIMEADILEAKGLMSLSAQQLRKAKKIASEHHKFNAKIEILKRQAIQVVALKVRNMFEEVDRIYKELMDDIHSLKEEFTYRQLNHFMFVSHRKEARNAPSVHAKLLKSINEHPILKQKKPPKSFFAQSFRYNLLYLNSRIKGNKNESHQYARMINQLWEEHSVIRIGNQRSYKLQLSNFLGSSIVTKSIEEFEENILKLESLPSYTLKDKMENFQAIAHLKLLFYLNMNRLEEAKALAPFIKNGLEQFGNLMNQARVTILYHNTLVLHFLMGEFEATLEWVDQILRKQRTEPRQDIKTFARILEFVVHYELGNDLILDSLFISATRRLHKTRKSGKYEKTILRHFRQLIKAVDKSEKKACFQQFEDDLKPFAEASPKPVGIEEMLYWLEARLTGRTIREVFAIKSGTERNGGERS